MASMANTAGRETVSLVVTLLAGATLPGFVEIEGKCQKKIAETFERYPRTNVSSGDFAGTVWGRNGYLRG